MTRPVRKKKKRRMARRGPEVPTRRVMVIHVPIPRLWERHPDLKRERYLLKRRFVALGIAVLWTTLSLYFSHEHKIDIYSLLNRMFEFGGVIAAEGLFRGSDHLG